MPRRDVLTNAGAAAIAPGGIDASPAAMVLYDDRAVSLDRVGPDPARDAAALWIRKRDLPRIIEGELYVAALRDGVASGDESATSCRTRSSRGA